MRILAKDLEIGMEIYTAPNHCMKIDSIELDIYKSSNTLKVIVRGVTRKFSDTNSEYWINCINKKNLKGNTEIDVNTFPNKPMK